MSDRRFCTPANAITLLRIPFAAGLVLCAPFSVGFWLCYVLGLLTDVLDGAVARLLRCTSAAGALLDSMADLCFAAALAVVAVRTLHFPAWLWAGVGAAAVLRLSGYAVGLCRFHCFSALHTYANKLTGALIAAFPVLYALFGLPVTGGLLCAAALLSGAEELLLTLRAPALNRDCKGLFLR